MLERGRGALSVVVFTIILIHNVNSQEQVDFLIQGIRLVGGVSIGSGRVEIRINNTWAQICADLWSVNDASVVCRYLGLYVTQQVPMNMFGIGDSGYWLTQVQCSGQEDDLNQCNYTSYGTSPSSTCSIGYPANVQCLDLGLCGLLPEVTGGYISYDASTGTKTTATLNCFYGYLPLNGNNMRDCRVESTSWTGQPFACIPQICGNHPTVYGAITEVVLSASSFDGSYTVNTTFYFTCPDNSIMTSTCSYLPAGGAQWVGSLLLACPPVVGTTVKSTTVAPTKTLTETSTATKTSTEISSVAPTETSTGSNATGNVANNKNNNNKALLIGVIVPVVFVLLAVVTILTIGLVIAVKKHYKENDRIPLQSPDDHDATTSDGFDNPISTIPSEFANPLHQNPDEMKRFDQSNIKPPPDDGTLL